MSDTKSTSSGKATSATKTKKTRDSGRGTKKTSSSGKQDSKKRAAPESSVENGTEKRHKEKPAPDEEDTGKVVDTTAAPSAAQQEAEGEPPKPFAAGSTDENVGASYPKDPADNQDPDTEAKVISYHPIHYNHYNKARGMEYAHWSSILSNGTITRVLDPTKKDGHADKWIEVHTKRHPKSKKKTTICKVNAPPRFVLKSFLGGTGEPTNPKFGEQLPKAVVFLSYKPELAYGKDWETTLKISNQNEDGTWEEPRLLNETEIASIKTVAKTARLFTTMLIDQGTIKPALQLYDIPSVRPNVKSYITRKTYEDLHIKEDESFNLMREVQNDDGECVIDDKITTQEIET
ncbi:hypothetical protein KDA14_02300, partial [Candidatus Saccharibacteria bacterium]|nr:hypothetical protein [Candidatus Saccharibacteria bacterium]